MYLQRLGLRALPFRLTPDAAFYYPARGHAAPWAALGDVLVKAGGLTALIGPCGTGKTLLLQRLRNGLPTNVSSAHFNQSPATASELVHGLLVQFGHRVTLTGAALGDALTTILWGREAVEQRTVITIDNGHCCTPPVLNALVEHIAAFPHVAVVLVGEPALQTALLAATAGQTCALRVHAVEALHADEVGEYLQHRLDVAGAAGRRVFQSSAADMLMRITDGVPKQINRYADGAMTAAFDAMRDSVTAEDVRAAAHLLGTIDAALQRQRPTYVPVAAAEPPTDPGSLPTADRLALSDEVFAAVATSRTAVESAYVDWQAAVAADLAADLAIDLMADVEPDLASDLGENAIGGLKNPVDNATTAARSARYRLHLEQGGELERTIDLTEGVLTIGRSSQNDLQIPSRYVSRLHCTITRDGTHLLIEDLDSTNGVYLRGEPVWREPLQPGDVIQIGIHELRIERVDAQR